jgi:hypothetical protein
MNPEERKELKEMFVNSFIILIVLALISFIAFIIALLKT